MSLLGRLERPIRTINYSNAKILAPMVRICSLPFRYAAKQCGADIVYSEELIDKKLLQCERIVNEETQMVEYRQLNRLTSHPVYRTSPVIEDRPLVLQIGTANVDLAVQVAEKMFPDYDAIDINCGCPKHFSVHSGMGAKLLSDNQENMIRILNGLVKSVGGSQGKSVTCKIRLLSTVEATKDLLRRVEQTGVNAIAIHARYIPQRPRERAHLPLLSELREAVQIPLIANGDCFRHEDIALIREQTACDAVMIARGAIWNPAIFSSDERMRQEWSNPHVRALKLLQIFEDLKASMNQTRYVIQRTYCDESGDGPFLVNLNRSTTFEQMRSRIQAQMLLKPFHKGQPTVLSDNHQ